MRQSGHRNTVPPAMMPPYSDREMHQRYPDHTEDASTEIVPPYIQYLQSLSAQPRDPSTIGNFLAMMVKNARQKLRTPVGTLLETLLPFVFVVGLMAIWAATNDGNTSDTQYTNKTGTVTEVGDGIAAVSPYLCSVNVSYPRIRACTSADLTSADCPVGKPFVMPGLCAINGGVSLVAGWANFKAPRAVPSIDEMIMYQWLARISYNLKLSAMGTAFNSIANSGQLWVAPNNTYSRGFLQYLQSTSTLLPYIGTAIKNDVDAARSELSSKQGAFTVWALVEFGSGTSATNLDVTIHVNRTGVPLTSSKFSIGNGIGEFSSGLYLASGFITLQDQANRYFESQVLGVATPAALVHVPMPWKGYDASSFLASIGTIASLFLVFGYIYPVSQLVKRIVEEKEQRVREAMMIMGLSPAPFYGSWVITYFIMQVVTSLACAGLLKGTMLPKSDFAIIWALYFMFGLSNITFSSLLSSFFNKSRIAALVAPVIFFICAIPSFALPDTTPASTLIIISLLSPTAFANGMNVLVNQEITGGMTQGTIGDSFNGYPMSAVIAMLVIDTVLYMLLTLYLDAVLPSEWGTRSHPLFCFVNPWRWWSRNHSAGPDPEEQADGRYENGEFEACTPGLKPSVEMRGMRKVFQTDAGPMVAVNSLSYNLYDGQVFCLLGHNGAGKTTAMNLMTGMLEMDAGDCYFHGYSVKHDLDKVRREIGYCPQHNILWPELTCREHLYFFARLKGLDAEQRERAVEAVLKAVDLEDKADKLSSELSGGQKRKLSVAIAFVGGSRVVFLDEPSAGMDVEARRHTWDLIKHMCKGRTLVLTTHYMEEADLLGHTIAIMSKGRLQCAGSGVFLKSRLGVGYNFTVTCAHGMQDTSHIVQAVSRFVPDSSVNSNAAGEVSLRLPMASVPQFPALLRYFEDNGPQLGVRGHGISVTTLEEIFIKLGHDEETGAGHSAVAIDAAREKEQHELMFTPEVAACRASSTGQARALLVKRFHYSRRDTRTIVMQVVLPVVAILIAMLLTLIQFPDAPKLTIKPSMYSDTVTSAYANCPPNWSPMYFVNDTVAHGATGVTDSIQMSNYLLNTFKAHEKYRIGSHVCVDTSVTAFTAATFFTNTSIFMHSAPEALWELHTPYMRYGTGQRITTSISSHPFPLSPREEVLQSAFKTLFVALFIMIPFTFVPSTFVAFVVKERETRALQLQQASGLKFIVYWISNFVFDLFSFFLTAILVIVVFAIFSRSEYIGDATKFFATLVLFMIYGLASVGGAYAMSFAFDSHSTAQNIVMLFNFICGFLLVLVAFILDLISSTSGAASVLKFFFRVVPSYCLGEGILNLALNDAKTGYSAADPTWAMGVVGWPMLYLAIEAPLWMALTLYLDSPLRRTQQHALTGESDAVEAPQNEDEDVSTERREIASGSRDSTDVVVVKHLRKVYHGRQKNVAVKNLSFGVHRGEVFGFLGTNGAGKTTTISILCGEHMATSGHAYVGGYDVMSEAGEARKLIGYCPQFDATHDLLTVDEHLELYCGLHGIDGALRQEVITRLINVCGLVDHRAKESRSLSGGNRRKLSVAISLIGAPEVVFLDEPSAGMDPMARRGLFDVIEQIARRCSVVLTTHHLEEVEALSNRVGIMVQGELKCVGPLGHLKSKFGSGFEMMIRVRRENLVDATIGFIHGNIRNATIQERRGPKLTIALPKTTRLSEVFALVETNKDNLGITDYSVAQTSLESVFLHIAETDEGHHHE